MLNFGSSRTSAAVRICGVIFLCAFAVSAQWIKQTVATNSSFRGLSVVSEKIVWASGTGGTVIRTVDGGKSWNVIQVPEASKLDFRDIEAFDANTAYILSIGNGDSSRIYKTVDGGKTWMLQFKNDDEKAFFDAIACWDKDNCIAMSDPVDHKFLLIDTTNGGGTWAAIASAGMPAAKDGEAAFAASGTCLIVRSQKDAYIITGGNAARVYISGDKGKTWKVFDTPITSGTAGSGIFSIAMLNGTTGVIVGGNYEKPEVHDNNLAFTSNGGRSFHIASGLTGYRSGVTFVGKNTILAAGSSGSDITYNGGKDWANLDKENYNAVASKGENSVWAVGAKGLVARLRIVDRGLLK